MSESLHVEDRSGDPKDEGLRTNIFKSLAFRFISRVHISVVAKHLESEIHIIYSTHIYIHYFNTFQSPATESELQALLETTRGNSSLHSYAPTKTRIQLL